MRQRSCAEEEDVEAPAADIYADVYNHNEAGLAPRRWHQCRALRLLCVVAVLCLGVWTVIAVAPSADAQSYLCVGACVVVAVAAMGSLWWCAMRPLPWRLRRRRPDPDGRCLCVVQ
ncbi:hypothetical protein psal_cds_1213 [Pandoravirus salinus]|uniref:Uncharacterized protein n=1 Tax=Pandoravirus salinus TaxID=1349410 RepID=S4W497_9VIRU|nr:hypothetical protein psal_cds_1213 [Pandoravirus salinus]AGO85517.1 hypothetical protein psal_cds_1213 [Pandoravirus salinus]